MAMRDYYEVLGLQKGATADEIKKAYRKLAIKWHPDKWQQASEAEQKTAEQNFKEVNEAYAVLSDEQKRARYDQFGHAGMNGGFGGGGSSGGFDFNGMDFDPFDIFNAFFGGAGTKGRSRGGTTYTYTTSGNPFSGFEGFGFGNGSEGFNPFQQAVKGQDINITLRVSLDDVMNGVDKKVKIKHSVADATGTVRQVEDIIPIHLPKGVMEGQKFMAKGKGNAAPGGKGTPGDLVVNIEEIPHPELLRDHQDLVYNCLISFPTAALGGPVEIPTLNGRVRINVPAGTQPGKILRLKGKGLPSKDTGIIGDLIVNILVFVPEKLSADEKKAVEKLSKGTNCIPTEENRKSMFSRIKYFFTKQE